MTNPYAAWKRYHEAGWTGILPLPHRKKHPVPEGTTGREGKDPSYADMMTWGDDGNRNIALRMPTTVIGIDVDHYGDKRGGDTIEKLETELGKLPPTWKSGSRQGTPGIYYYTIPDGYLAISQLTDVEMIQHHHRYSVVWPSENPSDSLNVYQWTNPDGELSDEVPSPGDFPPLPTAWRMRLIRSNELATKENVAPTKALSIMAEFPEGDPCKHILAGASKVFGPGAKHELYNEAVLAICGAGRKGCPGAKNALSALRENFMAVMSTGPNPRTAGEASNEWNRSILGAIGMVVKDPQGTRCVDDVISEWMDHLEKEPAPALEAGAIDTATTDDQPPAITKLNIDNDAYLMEQATARFLDLLVNDKAKTLFNTHKLGEIPAMTGIKLDEFLKEADEEDRWRIEGLWPSGGRTFFAAAAKAGKTTMVVGNVIPAIVDGHKFLDEFVTQPLKGTLAYLNMEVSKGTLRIWMREIGIQNMNKVVVSNMRSKAGNLALSTPDGRQRLGTWFAENNVEVAILDPLAPVLASLGLDENSNTDVATFFSWWSEALDLGGVTDDLIVHHTGHAGQRSRGASRLLDEPDAIWTLNRGEDTDPDSDNPYGASAVRTFHAYGRDVDLDPQILTYDPNIRRLSLGGSPKLVAKHTATTVITKHLADRREHSEKDVIEAVKKNPLASTVDAKALIQELINNNTLRSNYTKTGRNLMLAIGLTVAATELETT